MDLQIRAFHLPLPSLFNLWQGPNRYTINADSTYLHIPLFSSLSSHFCVFLLLKLPNLKLIFCRKNMFFILIKLKNFKFISCKIFHSFSVLLQLTVLYFNRVQASGKSEHTYNIFGGCKSRN